MIKKYKIPTQFKEIEQSHRSINILESKTVEYLKNLNNSYDIYFPDTNTFVRNEQSSRTNVVFMGGFLKRLFEIQNWYFSEIVIWVLCQSSKRFFVEVLGFDAESINIIPRSAFQSKNNSDSRILNQNEPIHLIYSGRFSQQKNFDILLAVYKEIQNSNDLNIKLICIGGYDNSYHEDLGEYNFFDFKKLCENYIESFTWKNAPHFIDWLPADQWTQAVPKNSLFISLSTYICEDFGLSVLQAQEEGLQCILTDWGGHSDALNNEVLLINPAQLPTIYDHEDMRNIKIKNVANKILDNLPKISNSKIDSTLQLNENNKIPVENYKKLISELQKELWPDNLLVQKYGLPRFAESSKGIQFFQKFFNVYSGRNFSCDEVYFVNDLNSNSQISSVCLNNISEFKKNRAVSCNSVYLPTKDFENIFYAISLQKAQRYIFTYFNTVHLKIVMHLLKIDITHKKEFYVPKSAQGELEMLTEIQIFYY